MVDFDHAFYNIERVFRMIMGKQNALDDIDISSDGFWRSFAAIIFALPAFFFGWVIEARDAIASGSIHSKSYLLTTNAFMDLLAWLLPILALAFLLKPLGYERRFSHLIIVRNWFSVIVAYAYTFLSLPALAYTQYSPPLFIILIAVFAIIVITINLTRICLDSSNSLAVGLVIGEFVLMIIFTIAFFSATGYYDGTTGS